jgi:hypothetical protein
MSDDGFPPVDENGYTPALHDPRHKKWIGVGFCIQCGGYACTTPDPDSIEDLRRKIKQTEDRLEVMRLNLQEMEAKR